MPSCMRAPPDSTKPTTGARASAGEPDHAHDRVGVRLAQGTAHVAGVLGVAEHGPPLDAAGAAHHAVAGAGLLAHVARGHLGADDLERARVAEHARGARAGVSFASTGGVRARAMLMTPPPGRAPRCARRSRTSSRSPIGRALAVRGQRPRRRRARSRGRGPRRHLAVAERGRRHALAQREHRRDRLHRPGGAEQVADGRLGGGHRHAAGAARPAPDLSATVSARSLSGVEVPWAFT